MPSIGTYNGVTIVQMPATPGFRELNLKKHDSVAVLSSPFTGQVQTQNWPGADWWHAEVSMPQMNLANAAAWSAFFSSCRGMLNVFPLGHPFFTKPQGRATSADVPVLSGVNAAMGSTLITRGWRANKYFLLAPGDKIQLGATPTAAGQPGLCRLHEVIDAVDTDALGNATLNIWPSLRETLPDGTPIILKQPRGLFRLAVNDTSILATQTRLSGLSFQVIEAR